LTNRERGQSGREIALAIAAVVGVLALAIFVVVPMIRPGESTTQRDAYIRAVATQQALAGTESLASQRVAAASEGVQDAESAPAIDAHAGEPNLFAAGGSDRREEIMFVALFGVGLLAMVGGSWFALTRGD
jgi:hypothetical protein